MSLLVTLVVGLVDGRPAGDDRVLVVDEDGAVSLVDTATGETAYTVADAVVAPDRSRLFRTSPTSGGASGSTPTYLTSCKSYHCTPSRRHGRNLIRGIAFVFPPWVRPLIV